MTIVSGICLGAVIVAAHNTTKVVALGHQNHRLAVRANRLANDIQSQRQRSLISDCNATNAKYRNAVHRLAVIEHVELNGDPKHGIASTPVQIVRLFKAAGVNITNPKPIIQIEQASIRGSYLQTVLLIGALVPKHSHCRAYAHHKAPTPNAKVPEAHEPEPSA